MSTQPDPQYDRPVPTEQPPATRVDQKPKKKKRVFMWVFLAIQALFIIWIIAGANSASSNDCASQVNEFFTQKDCEAATGVGAAIGVGLILGLWAVVDFILVIIWAVVRLSSRSR